MATEDPSSFSQALTGLIQACYVWLSSLKNLMLLELQLAGKNLILIIALAIFSGVLFLLGWIFCVAALAVWLAAHYLTWPLALLAVGGLHLFLIIPLVLLILRAKYYLSFPATRQQLGLGVANKDKEQQNETIRENS